MTSIEQNVQAVHFFAGSSSVDSVFASKEESKVIVVITSFKKEP